jgi:hypothetical protein
MAGPAKRASRRKEPAAKKPTAQELQIRFTVSLRKRDKELEDEFTNLEKGDRSARARELMYKGLMAERNGDNASGGAANQVSATVDNTDDIGDLSDRKMALMIENLDENF